MNCDKRAKEREIYEMHKTERELEEEEARRQLEKEREEEEKIYIKNLRKQLVHKPNPIRKYRSVEIKQSEKELTEPRSPEWQSKKRRKLRVWILFFYLIRVEGKFFLLHVLWEGSGTKNRAVWKVTKYTGYS